MTAVTERVTVAGVEVSPDHFIGGERVAGERRFEDISPMTNEVIAEISRAGEEEVDCAVRAAHDAFPDWADLGPAGRAPVQDNQEARGPGGLHTPEARRLF